ncbi:hypothetical protein CFBP3846_P200110 (plasmid) [Pseudomonas syringae pv. avii]|uniref:Uncharacterized protein n=2 Tax=Pseudomonas syringae TaxID=317 RepID=A0ABY1UFE6_PSESX|nr:hypothetical protein CFBP3846_P200110 [Pseudomonas syringae pv. avii]
MAGVQDVQDADALCTDAVDNQVVGMHNRFARSWNTAGTVDVRVQGESLDRGLKGGLHLLGSIRVALG